MYNYKKETTSKKVIVVDDMILTTDMPTTAGSKMLDGFMSLIESEALAKLKGANYEVGGKASVGEFAFDLVGESAYNGAIVTDGKLENASAKIIKTVMLSVHYVLTLMVTLDVQAHKLVLLA